MSKQIEVEGNELAIKNSNGDIAIIPANDRQKVLNYIEKGMHKVIDKYVNNLPVYSKIAEDGLFVEQEAELPGDPLKTQQQTQQPQEPGIKSFLRKAAEMKGIEYTDDDANTLIRSFGYDYGKLVTALGKSTGISDDGIADFKTKAYQKFNIVDLDPYHKEELKLKDSPLDIDEPDGFKKYDYLRNQYDQTKYLLSELDKRKPSEMRKRETQSTLQFEGRPIEFIPDPVESEIDPQSYTTRRKDLEERMNVLGNLVDEQARKNLKDKKYVSEQSMQYRKISERLTNQIDEVSKELIKTQELVKTGNEGYITVLNPELKQKLRTLNHTKTLVKKIYTALEAPIGSSTRNELNGFVQGLFNSTPIEDFATLGFNELGRNVDLLRVSDDFKKQLNVINSESEKYGNRADGTKKGPGWLGTINLPNGDVASEYSIGVEFDGKEIQIPTLIPSLSEDEIKIMINDIIPNNKPVPPAIANKAIEFAYQRLSEGMSPFITNEEAALSRLKPEDAALLRTYQMFQDISSRNQGNFWYTTGEGVQDMIPFIVEFSLTGGIGGAAKKSATEGVDYLLKKMLKRYAERETALMTAKTLGSVTKIATQPLLMPSTYKMTVEKQLPTFENGKIKEEGMDPTSAFFNSWVEMMAEVAGEDIPDMMKVGFRNSIIKQLAKEPAKAKEILLKTMYAISSDAGIPSVQGMPFELIGEEITGALQALQYDDYSFYTPEQQLQLLAIVAVAGGSSSLLTVPQRIQAKSSFEDATKKLLDNPDKRFTDAVTRITENYKDANDGMKAYQELQKNFRGTLTAEQYKTGLDYLYKAYRYNQMSVTRSAQIEKGLKQFGDNSGNMSTVEVDGEVLYIRNPEDAYNPNEPETYKNILFAKTQDGETKTIMAGKVGAITTQTQQDIEAITEQEMNMREQQYIQYEKAKQEAAKRRIEPGRQVSTIDGKRTVSKINANGTITTLDDKGQAFIYNIDDVEPLLSEKEKEQQQAELEALQSGIAPEAKILNDQNETISGGRTLRVVDFSNGQSKIFVDGKETITESEEEREILLNHIYSQEIETLSLEIQQQIAQLNQARKEEIAALPADKPIESGLKAKEINKRYDAMIAEIEAATKQAKGQEEVSIDEMTPEERFNHMKDMDPDLARDVILDDIAELTTKAEELRNETSVSKSQKVENLKKARELDKEAKRLQTILAESENELKVTKAIHIFNEFNSEMGNTASRKLEPWQEDFLSVKVNESSFAEHSDRNNITRSFAKAWFTSGDKAGKRAGNLDMIAQELSETHGIEVTEQDLVDFMLAYQNKNVRVTTDKMNELRSEYKELTGVSINNHDEWLAKQEEGKPTASKEQGQEQTPTATDGTTESKGFLEGPSEEAPFKTGSEKLQSENTGEQTTQTQGREKISETFTKDGKEVTYEHISEKASQDLRERKNALNALADIAAELAIHVSIINSTEIPFAIQLEEFDRFTKPELKAKFREVFASMNQTEINQTITDNFPELSDRELNDTEKGLIAKAFMIQANKSGDAVRVQQLITTGNITNEEWGNTAYVIGNPAVWHNGKVYIISDRITSVSEMKKNIIHEVAAHMGFRRLFVKRDGASIGGIHYSSFKIFVDAFKQMSENDRATIAKEILGEEYSRYFNERGNPVNNQNTSEQALSIAFAQSAEVGGKMYNSFNDLMQDIYISMSKKDKLRLAQLYYPSQWMDFFDENGNEKSVPTSVRTYLADEYLAEKSEAEETLTFIQRLMQMIRKAFNFTGKQFNNADVITILNTHRQGLRDGFVKPETGATIKPEDLVIDTESRFKVLGETGTERIDKIEEATTRLDNLNVAREMETAKYNAKDIKQATGWERGADEKWRYETKDIELNTTFEEIVDNYLKGNVEYNLPDIITDSELFSAYPELKETKIQFYERKPFNQKGGFASPESNTIGVTLTSPDGEILGLRQGRKDRPLYANDGNSLKSVLLHEIQHLIQNLEGFEQGGNPETVLQRIVDNRIRNMEERMGKENVSESDRERIESEVQKEYRTSRNAYLRLAGEVESRNVQSRMKMTDIERQKSLLEDTEDVAREDQIFLLDGITGSNTDDVRFKILGEKGAKRLDDFNESTQRLDNLNLAREMENGMSLLNAKTHFFNQIPFELQNDARKINRDEDTDGESLKRIQENPEAKAAWANYLKSIEHINEWNTLSDKEKAKRIRLATGWEKGADGKWRYEVDDIKYKSIEELEKLTEKLRNNKSLDLVEFIDDPELFTAYPGLKYVKVVFDKNIESHGSWESTKGDGFGQITINPSLHANDKAVMETLVHEIQHSIQNIEGFARGGSPSMLIYPSKDIIDKIFEILPMDIISDIMTRNNIPRDYNNSNPIMWLKSFLPNIKDNDDYLTLNRIIEDNSKGIYRLWNLNTDFNVYTKLSGEVEARNVESRMGFTYQERLNKLLEETEDVSRKDQLILRNGILGSANNDIRFKAQEVFYSPTEKAINSLKQEKGTVSQMKKMILDSGAKEAELDWMGFSDAFPNINGKVTKQELQDWVQQNKIVIDEVEKDVKYEDVAERTDQLTEEAIEELNKAQEALDRYLELEQNRELKDESIYDDTGYRSMDEAYDARDEILANENNYIIEELNKREDSTRYSQYQTPGGENYKELLLILPEVKRSISFTEYLKAYRERFPNSDSTDEEVKSYYNKGISVPDKGKLTTKSEAFMSGHWDEPNIIAHIRMNERVVNGENVLFIEEIQSDWAQKGKKEGFKSNKKIEELSSKLERNRLKSYQLEQGYDGTQETYDKISSQIEELKRESADLMNNWLSSISLVPDMPFKQTDQWVNLATRRIARYAAENGFDRIAWTNGEMQADRYDLSKQVNHIHIEERDGKYLVDVWDKSNNKYIDRRLVNNKNELSELIGKNMTDKFTTEREKGYKSDNFISEDQNGNARMSFEGLDLKIGGEGMKAFYDSIVPKSFSKIGKKFGAAIGQIQVANENVQSIPVTQSMVESVLTEGVPMFKANEKSVINDKIRFKTAEQSKIITDARLYPDFESFVDAYQNTDFRDSHSAPSNSKSDLSIEERMNEGDDFNLIEVAQGYSVQPDDYFDPRNGARWYGYDDKEGMQSYWAIRTVFNNIREQIDKYGEVKKTPKIIAYRAVPKSVEETKLIDRDWITFSRDYAVNHGEHRFGEKEYKIIKQSVPADQVWWDGNDINEWGYDTGGTESLRRSDLKRIWDEANANPNIRFKGMYHGSPHSFDKFSMKHIGSGEGTQAYGWGLYFTEREDIAKSYAKSSSENEIINQLADESLAEFNGDKDAAILANKELLNKSWSDKKRVKKVIKILETGKKLKVAPKNLYKVKIHEDKNIEELNFLRWDKEVSNSMFDKIEAQGNKENNVMLEMIGKDFNRRNQTGRSLYHNISTALNSDKKASLFLLRAGIDGVQYPTEFTTKGQHEESFNYVVFDENAIEIDEHIRFKSKSSNTYFETDDITPETTSSIRTNISDILNNIFEENNIDIRLGDFSDNDIRFRASQQTQERERRTDKEAYKKAFKTGGEKIYELLYEKQNAAITQFGDKFLSFLSNTIGDKKNAFRIVENNHTWLMLHFQTLYPELFNEGNSVKKFIPNVNDLLNSVGYTIQEHTLSNGKAIGLKGMYRDSFVPDAKTDLNREVDSEYHSKSVICYYNHPESRLSSQFVFTIESQNAKTTPTSEELKNNPSLMTPEWDAYLDKIGRKNEDGTYNFDGLEPNFNDPFSLSFLMIRIGKDKAHGIETISRYNHSTFNKSGQIITVPGNPNATLGNKLDKIVDGLKESLFASKNITVDKNGVDLSGNVRMANDGKLYVTEKEMDGVYVGDGFYIDRGNTAHVLDPSKEALHGIFIIRTDNTIDNILTGQHSDIFQNIHKTQITANGYKFFFDGEKQSFQKEIKLPDGTIKSVTFDKWVNDNFVELTLQNGELKLISDVNFNYYAIERFCSTQERILHFELPNVRSIGDNFFLLNNSLKSIKLPNVKTIGNGFLRYNSALQTIELPNVESIGDEFIHINRSLKSIELPNVKSIGNGFLYSNQTLENIILPNVELIGHDFLSNNLEMKTLILPNVEIIGNNFLSAYENSLRKIELPNVKNIGNSFLFFNVNLQHLILPNVTIIGSSFLYANESLQSIELPNVRSIGRNFLYRNKSIKNLKLPNVISIEEEFLKNNILLESIELPKVESIGGYFLNTNESLKSIKLPNVKSISDQFITDNRLLQSIELPNVKSIGDDFLYCNELLQTIDLPNVESIGNGFLHNNQTIERIEVPSVTKIKDEFMMSNKSLKSINIQNVKSIGEYFLYSNESLQSLEMPNLKYKGQYFLRNNHSIRGKIEQQIGDNEQSTRFKVAKSKQELVDFVKDSKVKETVYHGYTGDVVSEFNTPTWFAFDKDSADEISENGQTISVKLSLKNPYEIKTPQESKDFFNKYLNNKNSFIDNQNETFKKLINHGYDGFVIYPSAFEGEVGYEYSESTFGVPQLVVFSPDQILIEPEEKAADIPNDNNWSDNVFDIFSDIDENKSVDIFERHQDSPIIDKSYSSFHFTFEPGTRHIYADPSAYDKVNKIYDEQGYIPEGYVENTFSPEDFRLKIGYVAAVKAKDTGIPRKSIGGAASDDYAITFIGKEISNIYDGKVVKIIQPLESWQQNNDGVFVKIHSNVSTRFKVNTRKVKTRFMDGNIDLDGTIFDILRDEYGIKAVLESDFDTDNAIYSDGFINAIEDGKIPTLELYPTDSYRFHNALKEYHHVLINGEAYNVYFKSPDNVRFKIQEARKQIDTNPSEAQKAAGNYQKGHININGFDISIENPKGSIRSGVDRDGNEWSQEMKADYGYIRKTIGADKDHLDVFLGDNPERGKIYVIDQIDPGTGKFDEHKIMMGYDNMNQARKAYLGSYEEGWKGLRDITSVTVDELKNWIDKGDNKKPFRDTGIRFKIESSDPETRKLLQDFYSLRNAIETAETKKRKLRESAKESELTENPDLIQSHEYNTITNKGTIDVVRGYIDTYGVDRTMLEYFDGTFTDDRVFQNAIGIELYRHMNNDGNITDALKLLDKLEQDATKGGQEIQVLSLLKRMTPEGQLKYIHGKIKKINDEINKHNKSTTLNKKPLIEISEEEWAEIQKELNEVYNIIDIGDLKDFIIRNSGVKGVNKQRAIKLINSLDLNLDWLRTRAVAVIMNKAYRKVPESFGQKISTYQAVSHLLNPKTFLRNILSNRTMRTAERASRRLGAAMDYLLYSVMSGERVIGKATTSEQRKEISGSAKRKGKETTLDILIEVNKQLSEMDKYRDIATQWSIPSLEEARGKTNTFQSQFFGALEKGLTESLVVPDEISKEKIRKEYLAEYKNRTGLEPDADIEKEAEAMARYMTFQDDSWLSTHLTSLKKLLNGIGIANFGMGDLLIKYTRVPGNIITRTFEYSPFGAMKALIGIAKLTASKDNITREQQMKIIMGLSRALTGTAIMTLGYVLAKASIGAGDDDDNDEVKKLSNEAGLSGHKLNVSALIRYASGKDAELEGNDVLMNYDWLQPVGSLIKAGSEIALSENFGQGTIDVAVGFSELPSFMIINKMISEGMYSEAENIGEKAYDVITVPLVEGAGGFVPSPIRQISSIIDKTARDTYYSGEDKLTQAGVKVIANIPGLRSQLPARVRPTGEDKVFSTDNALLDIISTFGPATLVKYEPFVDREILNQISKFKSDKGTSYIPLRYAPKTVIISGERIKLTKEEQGFYMRTYGKELMYDYIPEANSIAISDIDEDTADEYAKLLSDYNKAAQDIAKEELINMFPRFAEYGE